MPAPCQRAVKGTSYKAWMGAFDFAHRIREESALAQGTELRSCVKVEVDVLGSRP